MAEGTPEKEEQTRAAAADGLVLPRLRWSTQGYVYHGLDI